MNFFIFDEILDFIVDENINPIIVLPFARHLFQSHCVTHNQ